MFVSVLLRVKHREIDAARNASAAGALQPAVTVIASGDCNRCRHKAAQDATPPNCLPRFGGACHDSGTMKLAVVVAVLLGASPAVVISQSTQDFDAQSRRSTVERIQRTHGLTFDETHPLGTLLDTEARLNTVARLKSRYGAVYGYQSHTLSELLDIEARMGAAARLERRSGQRVDWRTHSLSSLLEAETGQVTLPVASARYVPQSQIPPLPAAPTSPPTQIAPATTNTAASTRVPEPAAYGTLPRPATASAFDTQSAAVQTPAPKRFGASTSAIPSEVDDLNWEVRRLRRNADTHTADEFATRVKRLERRAEDLSSQSSAAGASTTASQLDDTAWSLRRTRREIEAEPNSFYRDRDTGIGRRLKRAEQSLDDAGSSLDD